MIAVELIAKQIFDSDNFSIVRCKTGDVNTSYIVSANEKKVFIKIQDKRNFPAFYNGQIQREAVGLKTCKKNNIPCPSVLHYDYENKFIVMECIEYPLLSQLWSGLNNSQKTDIKQSALEITKKINSITSPKFGAIYSSDIEQFDNWGDCYYHLINVAVEDCLFYGTLNKNDSQIILEAVKENMTCLFNDKIAHFNHLDFHWNNIFLKQTDDVCEIAGIIDFGSSLFVPNYMDLFRLEGGFLYGTERFYTERTSKPYQTDDHQLFCADLLNTMDYFVFLSFTSQANRNIRIHIIDICKDYLNYRK